MTFKASQASLAVEPSSMMGTVLPKNNEATSIMAVFLIHTRGSRDRKPVPGVVATMPDTRIEK